MHAQMVFKMLDCLVKGLLASLKTLTNSQDCSESRIRISVLALLLCHWRIFFSVHVIAGFWNHFQDHSRLSEKESGFIEASRKNVLFSIFSTIRQPKIAKAICAHTKSTEFALRTLKKHSSHNTVPGKGCEVMGGAALRE
jgi:hypothetical protein